MKTGSLILSTALLVASADAQNARRLRTVQAQPNINAEYQNLASEVTGKALDRVLRHAEEEKKAAGKNKKISNKKPAVRKLNEEPTGTTGGVFDFISGPANSERTFAAFLERIFENGVPDGSLFFLPRFPVAETPAVEEEEEEDVDVAVPEEDMSMSMVEMSMSMVDMSMSMEMSMYMSMSMSMSM